jgi:hypothetical protein
MDFNLQQCNPSTLKDTQTTCLPQDMLLRLRDAWNERFPDHSIPTSLRKKDEIWRELRKRMQRQYECASEYCAITELADAPSKTSAAKYFRPAKPAAWAENPTEWHDTLSIARVMEQYEQAYPHFEFIGPVPIDFDKKLPGNWSQCVVDELCDLDLATVRRRGDHAIGIVFNLDPHDKPGSHWVCAYIDLLKKAAYYYDSYGYPPCPEIKRLLRRCRDQGCETVQWNDIRHQRKQSECGTYCMYVLISLLKGRSFDDICKNRVDDDTMNALRDILYATEKPRALALKEAAKVLPS